MWQGRFKSPVIQNDEHLLTVLRYIDLAWFMQPLRPASRQNEGRKFAARRLPKLPESVLKDDNPGKLKRPGRSKLPGDPEQ